MLRATLQEITPPPPRKVPKPGLSKAFPHERVYTLRHCSDRHESGASRVVRREEPGYICGVFGIGGQELLIIGLLFLVIFGPSKLPQMARDLGKFVTEARRSMDEFKGELLSDEDDEDEDRLPKRKR